MSVGAAGGILAESVTGLVPGAAAAGAGVVSRPGALERLREASQRISQVPTVAITSGDRVVGRLITGYTYHGLEHAISREGHGVHPKAILDALRAPLRILLDPVRRTVAYEGRSATVVLNEAGKVSNHVGDGEPGVEILTG